MHLLFMAGLSICTMEFYVERAIFVLKSGKGFCLTASILSQATFTLLHFRFYPSLLTKMLSAYFAPFSNEYAMKTTGVHIGPAKRIVSPLFKTKPFVNSCQKGSNRDFQCHCRVINSLSNKNQTKFSHLD